MGSIRYVINPAGHGGAGFAAWKTFQALAPAPIDPADVIVTERAGHARDIASTPDGWETIVAVGGDGTVNEIMTGLLDHPDPPRRLGIIPGGTGNDIARQVGIRSVEDAVRALEAGHDAAYDLVRADWQDEEGPRHGYAFLQAIAGFSGTPAVSPWMKRLLGPKLAYYLGAFIQVARYRPSIITVTAGEHEFAARTWMLVVGNAEWTSGDSMCLSPGARMDDGELNVSIIRTRPSKWKMTAEFSRKIADGSHVEEPDVEYFPARELDAVSDAPVYLDLDGEVTIATAVHFEVCPGALRIISGAQVH